jgi:hypothetical protein
MISSNAEEADLFRSHISTLHHRLENFHLHSGRGKEKERISLTQVYLRENSLSHQSGERYGLQYQCYVNSKPTQFISNVIKKNGTAILSISQTNYNLAELDTHSDFVSKLTLNQQSYLRAMYKNINPRLVVDLTNHGAPEIRAGTYKFTCSPDELFAGVCEVIYSTVVIWLVIEVVGGDL